MNTEEKFENERPVEKDFFDRFSYIKALHEWNLRRSEWIEANKDHDWLAKESQKLLELGRQERYRERVITSRKKDTTKQKEIDKF